MKIMTDFLPSKKDLLNAMAAIAAPVNKAIKKGQESQRWSHLFEQLKAYL